MAKRRQTPTPKPARTLQRKVQRQKEAAELALLQERIAQLDDEQIGAASQFLDLPLSTTTLQGLKQASFVELTEIQRQAIPPALQGHDVLGAARTGSGKTLAFLVPVIETLVRHQFTEFDGLGALVVLPTRELAVQIFEVLTKIGAFNPFLAGLVIGGKDVKYERERVGKMNILIGTPGRILQHMDQSVGLNLDNLQVLVLDEADRILDMGFKHTVDLIVANIPPTRQTLLFSATQTKSVGDLARLSLTNPRYVGVGDGKGDAATPQELEQHYVRVELDDKLDTLWLFIKTHLKSKILVFFSSSKQVHYVYETFRTMQPGISLMKLHGRQKQTLRLETTDKFLRAQHACLFATDVVARGLDFPAIDWVVQVDCPEDAATYIHRVGRAARAGRAGKLLLFLQPLEEPAFVERLAAKHVDINRLNVKQARKKLIRTQLQALCFGSPELKYLGQKAFVLYMRLVHLQKDKEVFKFADMPAERYAALLGLPQVPRVTIASGKARELKNTLRQLLALDKTNEDGETGETGAAKVRTKYDRMFERQNQTVLSQHYRALQAPGADDSDDSEDDFMAVKRHDHELGDEPLPDMLVPVLKRAAKRGLSRKQLLKSGGNPTKMVFDDDGQAHPLYELEDLASFEKKGDARTQQQEYVAKESAEMRVADGTDKQVVKEKRQERKRRRLEAARRAAEESASELEPDLDRDMGVEERRREHLGWSKQDIEPAPAVEESYEVPETLEDLESLSARLLQQ